MSEDKVVRFAKPGSVRDALTELLREGAQRLLRQAVEAELKEFLAGYVGELDREGRAALVRNGHLPEREVLTGIAGSGSRAEGAQSHGRAGGISLEPGAAVRAQGQERGG